jgi:ABC-type dipeptide/oligopeptide/nickel transport system permease component
VDAVPDLRQPTSARRPRPVIWHVPRAVSDLIGQALPWTLALQLPAILVGWTLGNILGAVAAYRGGWFDRGAFLGSLALSSTPYYCVAILLVYALAVALPIFPPGGGYSYVGQPCRARRVAGLVYDRLRRGGWHRRREW